MRIVMIVMMSSSFDLERDGKVRSLWGIFLANVHLSVPKGASMAQTVWSNTWKKNPSPRTLITMVVCACVELILNNDRLIHLVHLTLGAFGFFNK